MKRVSRACQQCRSKHIKCNGRSPCSRCIAHAELHNISPSEICLYPEPKKRGRPSAGTSVHHHSHTSSSVNKKKINIITNKGRVSSPPSSSAPSAANIITANTKSNININSNSNNNNNNNTSTSITSSPLNSHLIQLHQQPQRQKAPIMNPDPQHLYLNDMYSYVIPQQMHTMPINTVPVPITMTDFFSRNLNVNYMDLGFTNAQQPQQQQQHQSRVFTFNATRPSSTNANNTTNTNAGNSNNQNSAGGTNGSSVNYYRYYNSNSSSGSGGRTHSTTVPQNANIPSSTTSNSCMMSNNNTLNHHQNNNNNSSSNTANKPNSPHYQLNRPYFYYNKNNNNNNNNNNNSSRSFTSNQVYINNISYNNDFFADSIINSNYNSGFSSEGNISDSSSDSPTSSPEFVPVLDANISAVTNSPLLPASETYYYGVNSTVNSLNMGHADQLSDFMLPFQQESDLDSPLLCDAKSDIAYVSPYSFAITNSNSIFPSMLERNTTYVKTDGADPFMPTEWLY
jgi:hypothetical protein